MKLTQARLKRLLRYDRETGIFRWIRGPGLRRDLDGSQAGVIQEDGRVEIMIDYTNYKAHRLAFLYVVGRWPHPEIDHRDGVRSNNSWLNLREVTRSVNQQNLRRAFRNNKTGFLGVVRRGAKFRAAISIGLARYFLGSFTTAELAHAAYVRAKRKLHEGCTL